ncbi:MAG: eCIS core domain-containing protein [Candidatus Rokuibacteriota bacterium]
MTSRRAPDVAVPGERARRGAVTTAAGARPARARHPLAPLLGLHRAAGNAAVRRLIQATLEVSQAGDEYEREADRVAEQVVQRRAGACHCGGTCEACGGAPAPRVQRAAETARSIPTAPPGLLDGLSGGDALDRPTRERFEASIGHDLGDVRIHRDGAAAAAARSVSALAFTVGRDVVFAPGRYAPGTRDGDRLLAHELTHVVQQGAHEGAAGPSLVQRQAPAGGPAPAPPAPGLSPEMLEQIARRLREAMAGLGTDEEAIYASLSGRTQAQVDAIARTYRQMYERDLLADVRDELTESEMKRLAIVSPSVFDDAGVSATGYTPADVVAAQLDQAIRGPGTDESAIFAALTGRTEAERRAIKEAYTRLTNRALEADLRDELSDAELTEALMLLNQGMLAPEDEIYLAIEGLGTDEESVFRVLDGMAGSQAAIEDLDQKYRDKYGDLTADLRSDLTRDEYARARGVLGPVIPDVAFEDCDPNLVTLARAAVPVAIQQVERAIAALSPGWARMSPPDRAVFSRYFDPSNSGGVDASFVAEVFVNFRTIRREFDDELVFECEPPGGLCKDVPHGAFTYGYTYWANIHVCPAFATRLTTPTDRARGLVHEITHNALLAVDRPYFTDPGYAGLTPRGPAPARVASQIPIVGPLVIGPLIALIAPGDTLYSPDAYSYFARDV